MNDRLTILIKQYEDITNKKAGYYGGEDDQYIYCSHFILWVDDRAEDCLSLAKGCLNEYGGGYRGDAKKLIIYHHGIQTVINVIKEFLSKGLKDNLQLKTLMAMGKAEGEKDEN
jgi:hypothetical protein